MATVPLALAVSICLGTADFLAGLKSRSLSALTVAAVSQLISLGVLAPVMIIAAPAVPSGSRLIYATLAGASSCVGITSLYRGLAVGKMSVVAPISATAAIVPLVVGVLGGERPSAAQDVGVLLALAGVVAVSRTRNDHIPSDRPAAAGVGFGLLAAVGGGGWLALMKSASAGGVLWATAVAQTSLIILLVIGGVLLLGRMPTLRVDSVLVGIGVLELASWLLFGAVSTIGLLSLVSVLSSLYPVVTVLLARIVLKEQVSGAQRFGIVLVVAGLALISGG